MTTSAPMYHSNLYLSIRLKILMSFMVLFVAILTATYFWFFTFSVQRAISRVTEDLDVLLTGALARVDGDAFIELAREAEVNDEGYSDDPRYWDHANVLGAVARLDPRSGLYTFIAGDREEELIFIGSSGAVAETPFGALFRESCYQDPECGDLTPNLEAIRTGELIHDTQIYEDRWGSWISGYAPIRNSQNQVVGALGVDFRADYVIQIRRSLETTFLIAFISTLAACGVVVFILARRMTEQVRRLTAFAARIGEGDYDLDLTPLRRANFPDEITTMANVFDIMIEKVAQREQRLKQQVADLQIQIDHARRDEQVREIVDNDFFQALQSKAATMRARRSFSEAGDEE